MEHRLRLLVLTPLFPAWPGEKSGNFILDQVRALAAEGADVTVLVAKPWYPLAFLTPKNKRGIDPNAYSGESFRVENAKFFSLPRFTLGERAYDCAAKVSRSIVALAHQSGFDVIHAHGVLMGHMANTAAETLGTRAVITIHGIETSTRFDDTEGKRNRIRNILDKASQVVLVGSPLAEHWAKYGAKSKSFTIVGNGCTIYPDLRPSGAIPRRKPVRVVAVSNYEESKGFDLLVEALASSDIREDTELVIVGGGTGFRRVRERAQELGLAESVHFTGQLSHRESLAEVMAADVFCLPSWREAFGIMYAEAMALGKLAMGCKGQGPSDFIRHMETGYLIEPGSTTAVADGLRWAIRNRSERERIARQGREYATRNLTWKRNAEKMMEIYRTLTAKHAGSGQEYSSTVLKGSIG